MTKRKPGEKTKWNPFTRSAKPDDEKLQSVRIGDENEEKHEIEVIGHDWKNYAANPELVPTKVTKH
jgi:hypothetical protein